MFKMRFFTVILLILFYLTCHAQGRYDIWYFGNGVGLDFNISPPQQLLNGALNASEGTSAICDSNGLLKYYTDGNKIWNAKHEVIANGDSLIWDNTSLQGSLIVKQPGTPNTFYVFGVVGTEHGAENLTNLKKAGMFYSIISKDSVVRKNVQLHNSRTERLTAYYHTEGDFYWIATTYGSTSYEDSSAIYLYKFTKDGISLHRKYNIAYSGIRGQMKFSPNGKLLALASEYSSKGFPPSPGKVQLFDFDSNNGFLSNPRCISGIRSHGLEFSPNSNLLYFSAFGANLGLFQVKVEEIAHTDFQNTQTVRLSNYSSLFVLQLAPDGKIYCNRSDSSLALIEKPNMYGPDCAFMLRALNYPTILLWGAVRISRLNLSLPQCVQNLIIQPKLLTQDACLQEKVSFKIMSSFADSIQWDFGEDGQNVTTLFDTVSHVYQNEGVYQVKAILHYPNHTDTLENTVRIYALPLPNIGNDTLLFNEEILELVLDKFRDKNILWEDGSGTESRIIAKPGLYSVKVTDGYCIAHDSMRVEYINSQLEIHGLCYEDSTTLQPIDVSIDSVQWIIENQTFTTVGPKNQFQYVFSRNGKQAVKINAFKKGLNRSWEDSVEIIQLEKDFLKDSVTTCSTSTLIPDLKEGPYTYLWSTGSTIRHLEVDRPGQYWLEISKNGCSEVDSSHVFIKTCSCNYHIPTAFSPNNDGLNDGFYLQSECPVEELEARIYSRWGELLYMSQSKDGKIWDGQIGGQPAPEGVYFYTLSFMNNGSMVHKFGTVHLLR